MIHWLRSLATPKTRGGSTPPPAQTLDQTNLLQELQEEVERLNYQLETAVARCDHARSAHAIIQRRVDDLRRDWPAVHARYFTHSGIQERLAGIPMNNRKRRGKN